MEMSKFLDSVIAEKWLKGNYSPDQFLLSVVERDETKTGIDRFVGLTSPNEKLKLPKQEYFTVKLIPLKTEDTELKSTPMGGANKINPETFFAGRDSTMFDEIKNVVQSFLNAGDNEKSQFMIKEPAKAKFKRFNGKPVPAESDAGAKNMFLIQRKHVGGNFINFQVPMGHVIVTIDANGNRTIEKDQSIDKKTGELRTKGDKNLWNATVFCKEWESPQQAVERQLGMLALNVEVADWQTKASDKQDLTPDAIEDAINNNEGADGTGDTKTGTDG